MTRSRLAQINFASGEISPLLKQRVDYERRQSGTNIMCGFLPLREGGFTRAPGTWFRGTTKTDQRARLIGFEFAANDALILEFTPLRMRVWRYGALVDDAGSPFELITPYDADAIERLSWVQAADVIYLADGVLPIQKLARAALDDWTIEDFIPDDGPFRAANFEKDKKLQASAGTGSVTLTADFDFFESNHVGQLIELVPIDSQTVAKWRANEDLSDGDRRIYDGNVYEFVDHGPGTGTDKVSADPPVHLEGIYAINDKYGWEFIHGPRGVVRITAITDLREATADVLLTVPTDAVENSTYLWAEGAWGDRHGHPAALEIFDQRLATAATPADPRTIWFSTVGNYDQFEPGTLADDGFAYTIAGEASLNQIVWLKRGRAGLHVGALGEEQSTRSTEQSRVIGPDTAIFRFDSAIGSRPVKPIAPDGNPIFVSREGRRLFEIIYSFEQDRNLARELSLPAAHIGGRGFGRMVFDSAPNRLIWLTLDTGDVAVCLLDPQEQLLGWATIPLAGGVVEDMAVTSALDGGADIVTLVVRRTIDGATKRYIEDVAITRDLLIDALDLIDVNHLFSATREEPGSATASFSLPHLANEIVFAWTAFGTLGPFTVAANGDIDIGFAVDHAIIGLLDSSFLVETTDIQAAARDGDTRGRGRRVQARVGLGLHATSGGEVRAVARRMGQEDVSDGWRPIVPSTGLEDVVRTYRGICTIDVPSSQGEDVVLQFRPVGAHPMTITATVIPIEEEGP